MRKAGIGSKKKKNEFIGNCVMCGKERYIYPVHIDKDITENWCRECIDEEETLGKKETKKN